MPAGPGGETVRVKLRLEIPDAVDTEATTRIVPAVAPAVAVTDAWPLLLVTALAALRVAVPVPPVTAKFTVIPASPWFAALVTVTTSGWPKGAFCAACW